MKQARMRFSSFLWPVNPTLVAVHSGKDASTSFASDGEARLESLGNRGRVVEGSGVFPGSEGPRQLEALRREGQKKGAGVLFVPGTPPMRAVLAELTAESSTGPEKTAYSFRFLEQVRLPAPLPPPLRVHTAGKGESLWHIAAAYDCGIEELLRKNPLLPHPWAVREGQEVNLPC